MACLPPSDWSMTPENTKGRVDLRKLSVMSIDPPVRREEGVERGTERWGRQYNPLATGGSGGTGVGQGEGGDGKKDCKRALGKDGRSQARGSRPKRWALEPSLPIARRAAGPPRLEGGMACSASGTKAKGTKTSLRTVQFTRVPTASTRPQGCKDIDDALHCTPLPNGNFGPCLSISLSLLPTLLPYLVPCFPAFPPIFFLLSYRLLLPSE